MDLMLIVESEPDAQDDRTIVLHGKTWCVKAVAELTVAATDEVPFICVSYVWGTARVQNPTSFGPAEISTATLPALLAAMQSTEIKAFWIDAFCVPTIQPARAFTLESMGFIYSQAAEVRAVLSAGSFQTLTQLSAGDRLDFEALTALENDLWVRSVWTYQEVVNSRSLSIICAGAPGKVIDGSHLLNGLGYTIHKYKESSQIDSFEFRRRYPALDDLETFLGDYMSAGLEERSALAVMSSMNHRLWTEEKSYFYAMIGAISVKPRSRADLREHLALTFMRVCEEKGDFSFIFSAAPRVSTIGETWRPCFGTLPSILPWHSWGKLQPGRINNGQLWLDRMMIQQASPLTSAAKTHLATWRRQEPQELTEEDLREQLYKDLVGMGFTGDRAALPMTDGLFFSQTTLPSGNGVVVQVIVSGTIRWMVGAPGLACWQDEQGRHFYEPGVFAGLIDQGRLVSVALA